MPRETLVHWDWLVYLEMFLAGTASGAYATGVVLELVGRGRSPLARTAHLLAFPLMALAGLLLIVDLNRPERFWHMILQSKTFLPMFKWWSPMSVGSWGVLLFNGFAFVSFVDALVASRRLSLGGWRYDRTLHGTQLGLIWSVLGGAVAFFVGGYSGVLLNVTNIPGWMESPLLGALFLAISGATGMAALLLIRSLSRRADPLETVDLARANTLVLAWLLLMTVAFLVTSGDGMRYLLSGLPLIALIVALVLVVVVLALRFVVRSPRPSGVALGALLVLVGGLLLRFAVVAGPQHV